jgi:Gly-Xaa carboxypeptidase
MGVKYRFSKLEITKVNTHGLLITWKGTDESLKPYLFMAHQDVVPVPETTVDRWTYPPYEAHYDGRFVWGRGSSDCKNNLIGVLEAFETLLQRDHEPKRTILAGFGFDEEISGYHGAQNIGKYLEEHRGRNSLGLIIDEGGLGIKDGFARPALGEKGLQYVRLRIYELANCRIGYFDVKINVDTEGGHSSTPKDHTGIGYLAQIISAIEDAPYSPDLTPVNREHTQRIS